MRLQDVQMLSPRVRQLTLVSDDRSSLPSFSAGSHISLRLETRKGVLTNSYSLIGSQDRKRSWQIAVQLAENSRGGSRFLHELEPVSARILSSLPENSFPLFRTARRHVFIAGGIGITPFLTFIQDVGNVPWELHYAVRSRNQAPFCEQLGNSCPQNVKIYASDENRRLNLTRVFENQPLGTHVYVCGSERLISCAMSTARTLGWPERYVHVEYFASIAGGEPFDVELARSGRTIHIDSGVSLLEGLEAAGIDVNYGCRGGACGACETVVLSGTPHHRDHYLSEEIRKTGKAIMPCVSRSLSARLVLDL